MTARRPAGAPAPVHSDAAHRAIEAELVRLTLGGRGPARHELRVDLFGRLVAFVHTFADAGRRVAAEVAEAMRRHPAGKGRA